MSDEEISKIIDGIAEDYTLKELKEEEMILTELQCRLDIDRTSAFLILEVARIWRERRGDRLPDWQLLLQSH